MSDHGHDQFAHDDPTGRYGQPATDGQQIEHPDTTGSMER